ncbi:MAG: protein kinase [Burkholderiales bacterium]|nr:protein kinase [Burkholderiales bacterium]
MPFDAMPEEADPRFPATEAAPLEALFGLPAAREQQPAPARAQPERQEAAATQPARLEAERAAPAGGIATFMYARLNNFTAACQALSGAELTSFVNDVRRVLSTAALQLGGEIAQRRPDSILCAFCHRPEDRIPNHAKRALHAAILTVHESVQLGARISGQLQAAGLPPVFIAVGVHLGEGEVTARANKAQGMVHATGEAVEIARLLEVAAADQHWSVVTSAATRQAAGTRVESGRSGSLGLPDDTFIEVVEIAGLVPRKGSTTPQSHYAALHESLATNQQLARSAQGTSQGANATPGGHLLIEDYRLLRKIGEGGIASVFLAEPTAGGPQQVLKVLRLDNPDSVLGLQRFMQEFALLVRIDHPNVTRIFRQDFSAGVAYIAMEYFPMGDLRTRMRKAMDPGVSLYYIRQIASGLEAIHEVGIVHRDLKPDNVMIRQDGIVAIADFGIAKQVSMQITDTGAGDIVGTPYYLSPEQVIGKPVDGRCDIYSLGVMAYEMLTGSKPYRAGTARELLQMHVDAPIPRLPPAHARLQPVLDRMMAKDPADRYESASALLDDLGKLG